MSNGQSVQISYGPFGDAGTIVPNIATFFKYLAAITCETKEAQTKKAASQWLTDSVHSPQDDVQCYADGSWSQNWQGGIGCVLKKGETLLAYKSKAVTACCALRAEAQALNEALQMVTGKGIEACSFYTDNKTLSLLIIKPSPLVEVGWRAYQEIFEAWMKIQGNENYTCHHLMRGHNELADQLARIDRLQGWEWDYMGFTFLIFREKI